MKHPRITLGLAAVLTLSLLSGCGGAPKETPSVPPTATVEPTQAPETSLPETSAPETSLPETSAPETSVPETTPPAETQAPNLILSHTDVTLKSAGASFFLQGRIDGKKADVTYASDNEGVAAVTEDGKVTAVAPGVATVTVTAGDRTARCIVRCRWTEPADSPAPETKPPVETAPPAETAPPEESAPPAFADLAAFAEKIKEEYSFGGLTLANQELMDGYYPGLSAIDTEQCLVYVCMISMNNGEFVLVQTKDSADVPAVKDILQARIDGMVNGGAFYPAAVEQWTNCSRVVSSGNYVMMVVHEQADAIVSAFNETV